MSRIPSSRAVRMRSTQISLADAAGPVGSMAEPGCRRAPPARLSPRAGCDDLRARALVELRRRTMVLRAACARIDRSTTRSAARAWSGSSIRKPKHKLGSRIRAVAQCEQPAWIAAPHAYGGLVKACAAAEPGALSQAPSAVHTPSRCDVFRRRRTVDRDPRRNQAGREVVFA
jgi:hypothetical protein